MTRRELSRVAERIQGRAVGPHCPVCSRPCCKLETLVLELSWKRLRALWGIDAPRGAFDRLLAEGQGPGEIRAQDGLYYAHGRPCPAYRDHGCTVYETWTKPPGCSDFPVYEDGGALVADLRCEALDAARVEEELIRWAGPEFRVTRSADRDFDYLLTFRMVPRRRSGPARSRRSGRP